jgi:hypothetical protein
MNTTHPVAPEEVMAFLDGELSAAEAQAISAHLDQCAECTGVAEQFRSTSQSLSRWSVPTAPAKLDQSVRDLATKTRLGFKTGATGFFVRTGFWAWRQWMLGLGSAVTLALILVAIATPNLLRSRMAAKHASIPQQYFVRKIPFNPSKAPASEFASGDAGRSLAIEGRVFGLDKLNGQPFTDRQDGQSGPMIARTVSLSVVVKDFAAARSSLDAILVRRHGYSAQLNVTTPENAPRSIQASLRIPSTALSSAVADLKTLGRVENESQAGEEVTQQHTDLVARLKNSRETEQRFRSILQQRTGNVVEVLQVEEGIARVRGDIERMEAEQKALEHRVDFTAVELQLTEEYKAQLNPPAPSVSIRVHNSFVAGYHNLSETILGILLFFAEYGLTLLLWLVILVLPVIFVRRRYRKALATV